MNSGNNICWVDGSCVDEIKNEMGDQCLKQCADGGETFDADEGIHLVLFLLHIVTHTVTHTVTHIVSIGVHSTLSSRIALVHLICLKL